ncbi:MAG: ATPase [Micavibrio aeruginosavorus]|uniref:ATPase n=1 Tax=Micavibrio aeruginosavorus TaxID=349221 RepID=A0A2W5PMA2_9BACT|nr:MAG: ATPase [Micavibrio aeruginosavorus]
MMTSSCCHAPKANDPHEGHSHSSKRDWMMIVCTPLILIPYLLYLSGAPVINQYHWLHTYTHSIHEFVNATWWGVLIGIFFLALLARVPREFVMSVLGHKKGASGIGRAMLAGVLLDLCSHGILMVGTKIYERGASIGQVMAFLIASPWNSISLTFILIAMIGLKLTVLFLVLSVVVAFISGLIFDALVDRKILPANPNAFDMPEDFKFWPEAKRQLSAVRWTPTFFKSMLVGGMKDSQMVVRWLLVGIVIASVLRIFFTPESFAQYFGPTALGMLATVFFATILEVCSEGSSPIAADLVTRAGAPGNAFAFLMAGVATDYTEVMVLKEATKSWKIALFLPLVTLPQVIILGILLNLFA